MQTKSPLFKVKNIMLWITCKNFT